MQAPRYDSSYHTIWNLKYIYDNNRDNRKVLRLGTENVQFRDNRASNMSLRIKILQNEITGSKLVNPSILVVN